MCLKMMDYAGVKKSRVITIVISNILYFVPAGVLLLILKLLDVNQFVLVGISGLFIAFYYGYIIKTDKQLNELIRPFQTIILRR